jgi:HK97 family phage prohead protease
VEIRSVEFEVRIADEQTRSVSGLAVPYGQTINIGGFQERVERGAFDTTVQVPLLWGHDHREIPIGRVTALRDTEAGLEMDAVLNETSRGKDAYIALKNGDVSKFSIGFIPEESRDDDGVIVRTKATLKEVSVVNFPAYEQASVTSVREANQNEKENNNSMTNEFDYAQEIGEVRGELADLSRKFDEVNERQSNDDSVQYRSAGEWLKGLANGDQAAKDLATRAYTGATSTDADNIRPTWINDGLKLLDNQRVVKGLFRQAPLPQTGNSIEYPYVKTQTGTVGVQAAEGDDLSYLELVIDTATAPVKTYGGYSQLSRQSIERSDVAYLEAVLRFQVMKYAQATEAAVQAALLATAATANEVELGGTAGAATPVQWIEAILDAKAEIDDNSTLGLSADVILVSRDVHKKIALLKDSAGRPIFAVNGDGQNTFGNLPLNGRLAGVIDGTLVVVGRNLPADTVIVASSEALITRESAGAPFHLEDENIINLTKDFSVYGYLAIAVPDVKAITFIVDEA